ncbi:MAG: hypothetical protein K8L91_22590, partial [Anaerolineae bacterium]|nr:hypothetical protein [Anaerolineae bacterium]
LNGHPLPEFGIKRSLKAGVAEKDQTKNKRHYRLDALNYTYSQKIISGYASSNPDYYKLLVNDFLKSTPLFCGGNDFYSEHPCYTLDRFRCI